MSLTLDHFPSPLSSNVAVHYFFFSKMTIRERRVLAYLAFRLYPYSVHITVGLQGNNTVHSWALDE